MFTLVATVFFAGAADRAFVSLGVGYQTQVWIYRGLTLFLPVVAFFATKRICHELRGSRPRRLMRVRRTASGGFSVTER